MPKASLKSHGHYLGLMRHAKLAIKRKAKKMRASKGLTTAIKFLKRYSR